MESLLDDKHIEQLFETLSSAENLGYIHKLYKSVSDGFADFAPYFNDMASLKLSPDEASAELHRLRNRYKNLGMTKCAILSKTLELLILEEVRDADKEKEIFICLKNSTFSSLNLFFQKYLP
jgi:hypothetical protein